MNLTLTEYIKGKTLIRIRCIIYLTRLCKSLGELGLTDIAKIQHLLSYKRLGFVESHDHNLKGKVDLEY